MDQYDAISSLVARLAAIPGNICNVDTVVATPRINAPNRADLNGFAGIIKDAQALISQDGALIPGAVSRLRKEKTTTVEVFTVKLSDSKGNAMVALRTHFGIIVIYVNATAGALVEAMATWGIPPQIKEVPVEKIVFKDREVIKEVPAPSLWKRIFG